MLGVSLLLRRTIWRTSSTSSFRFVKSSELLNVLANRLLERPALAQARLFGLGLLAY